MSYVKILSTTGSLPVAKIVAEQIDKKLPNHFKSPEGTLGTPNLVVFDNDNYQVQIPNVRGHFVFVVHTMVPNVNEEMMQLFTLLDAICCASPKDIAVVFVYKPYSRSDRKNQTHISTMSARIAKIINCAFHIEKIILLDPHDEHIKHYYDPPAEEITSIYLFVDYLKRNILNDVSKEFVVVYPDAGAHKRFNLLKDILHLPSAYIDKTRNDNSGNSKAGKIIGKVKGKCCIMIDDEMLGGGTVETDSQLLKNAGALDIIVCIIHPVLRKKGKTDTQFYQQLMNMPLDELIVTNSIPIEKRFPENNRIQIISIAGLLAEAISRMAQDLSISELFDLEKVSLYKV